MPITDVGCPTSLAGSCRHAVTKDGLPGSRKSICPGLASRLGGEAAPSPRRSPLTRRQSASCAECPAAGPSSAPGASPRRAPR
eukprot:CAMPEP_0168468010 /NCGR_PEP_ID=MMETSP0228-20121227/57483_1 /TAXON_ID=133427 /ORGANISM="Protoceratium reticulatum, Strain CCCM 535 (=CCMP 1889)" /LENGTH=82 /DNA_ID=CAMNT_0008483749 /DNA_START=38 /DNA_END=282 /DNA_ORIENTATION=+